MARKAYREAHALCLEVLRADSQVAGAWFLLGVLAADYDNHGRAAELFEKAIALAPADPRPRAHLARSLIALNAQADAVAAAEAAAALAPRDPLTLDTLGVVFSRAGLHARAVPLFEAATGADPRNASFQFNLAASRQFAGDFAGAEAAYAAAVALDPGLHRAWSARVTLARQTPERNFLGELTALMDQRSDDPDRALHLGHALAKTCEDLGDHEAALDWLTRAKAAKRAAVGYSSAVDAALFAAAAGTFRAGDPALGDPSEAPIFVVGLPRTGTTLVDRILSSHADVASVGELIDFGLAVKRAAATPSNLVLDPQTLEAARDADPAALGRAYLEAAGRLAGRAPRFVDKMPLNVLYAGLIHRALPNARIVCLRRHPMDAALANYRQLFATGVAYYDYAYGLEDVGRYVAGFEALVAHWRAVLPPDRFAEVAYEDIVADQEGQTRRLLAFCGLPWDPACLAFHENAAPVATASSVQVRQPLYASSVGRWRRYGAGLGPLRRALEAGGVVVE
ncbi:tetratricopeptide repeat-containing sulfotransferase family protein [uncultured Phenylobacterium sp.]|uniref:tetratricopeptide repeat-containing sulfotransferase family protein n=1 Tax=uncultured Phenylobacterium sp. TaxID=349273 RepID=UPI0025D9D771|nr:tetratricopeptide repeat-containing sulfotransferase family protein [uncultured Phenylobacterium sp.]